MNIIVTITSALREPVSFSKAQYYTVLKGKIISGLLFRSPEFALELCQQSPRLYRGEEIVEKLLNRRPLTDDECRVIYDNIVEYTVKNRGFHLLDGWNPKWIREIEAGFRKSTKGRLRLPWLVL